MADVSLMAVPSHPQDGTTCANCGAEVVPDQRYCLSCGHPVSPVRLGFLDVLQDQGTHPAPQWSAPGTLEVTPVGYAAEPQRGLGGWVRRNGPLFGLLSVLLLCLIAGLLLGHWASGGGGKASPSVIKVEGLTGAFAPARRRPARLRRRRPQNRRRRRGRQGEKGTAASGQRSSQRNEGRKSSSAGAEKSLPSGTPETEQLDGQKARRRNQRQRRRTDRNELT